MIERHKKLIIFLTAYIIVTVLAVIPFTIWLVIASGSFKFYTAFNRPEKLKEGTLLKEL